MYSPDTIDQLINLTGEIQGVLRIIKNRPSASAYMLLDDLCRDFARLTTVAEHTESSVDDSPIPPSSPISPTPVVTQSVDDEADIADTAEQQPVPDEIAISDIELETEPIAVDEQIEVPMDDDKQNDGDDEDRIIRHIQSLDKAQTCRSAEALSEAMSESYQEQVLQIMPDDRPQTIVVGSNDSAIVEQPALQQTAPQPQAELARVKSLLQNVYNPKAKMGVSSNDGQLRIEDVIARQGAKDLSRAFSINDRFRFVRTLFGSDAKAFDRTIGQISATPNPAQVIEHLYNSYGWNKDDQDVKDFVRIVSNHFMS